LAEQKKPTPVTIGAPVQSRSHKRTIPLSDLDLQMQMIEPEWGKTGISQELRDQLQQYAIENDNLVDEGSLWGLLGFYTRDVRLGNLSYAMGEMKYCRYYLDLAGDLLTARMYRSFLTSLQRAVTILELSQSKGGFLRRRQNTITSENYSRQETEPAKKGLFSGSKKSSKGY